MGPLCVVEREGHTEIGSSPAIRQRGGALAPELGLQMLWSQEGQLVRAADRDRALSSTPGVPARPRFDERYGPGHVRLPALRVGALGRFDSRERTRGGFPRPSAWLLVDVQPVYWSAQ